MSNEPPRRRSSAQVVRSVGLLAAVGVAVYALVAQWSDIQDALGQIGVLAPLLAFGFATAGLGMGAFAWRALLTDLGVPLSGPSIMRVMFVGQLGKYLPGGVWQFVAQMELGRDAGAGRREVGAVAVIATAINVAVGAIVAVACLPFTSTHALHRVGWLLALVPLGLALLHPRVLNAVINRALRLLRRAPLERGISGRGVVAAALFSVGVWVAFGAHLYVLAHPLAEAGHRLTLLAVGGFALAWVVGFLVLIAPSGVGAREAMLIVTLAPVMPTAPATAVALISRAVITVADLACALAGLLAARVAARKGAAGLA